MSETTELSNIEGAVKWFDPRKGYGFIVGPQGQDIFVHFSVIDQAEGFKTLRDGESVRYSASKGQKGWSATAVKSTRVVVNAPAQAN
jgi:CspA family cold shock protein